MSDRRKNWFKRLFGEQPSAETTPSPEFPEGTPKNDAENSGAEDAPQNTTENTPEDNSPESRSASPAEQPVAGSENHAEDPAPEHPAEMDSPLVEQAREGAGPASGMMVFEPSSLDDVDFYRRMRVALQPIELAEASVDTEDFGPDSPVRPFSGDTLLRLTLDMPLDGEDAHSTFPLDAEALNDRGPVEDLYRMGYRNLWQDLVDSDLHVTEISPSPKEKVWAFEGTSPYVGSAPIFLEELIGKFLPQIDMATGVLFTMPSSGQMLVRDVTEGMELFHTIGLLATASADEYFKSADKISPRLHLWHEGQIETISDIKMPELGEMQTEIQIKPTAYLMAQMNEGPDAPDDWMKGFGGPDDPDDPDDIGPDGPTPPPVV